MHIYIRVSGRERGNESTTVATTPVFKFLAQIGGARGVTSKPVTDWGYDVDYTRDLDVPLSWPLNHYSDTIVDVEGPVGSQCCRVLSVTGKK